VVVETHSSGCQTGVKRDDAIGPVVEVKAVTPPVCKPARMVVGKPPLGLSRLGLDLNTYNEKNKKGEKQPQSFFHIGTLWVLSFHNCCRNNQLLAFKNPIKVPRPRFVFHPSKLNQINYKSII
jgi:hypothetical protein